MIVDLSRLIFVLLVATFFTLTSPGIITADEEVFDKAALNEFLDEFYYNLQLAAESGDSTLSERTNLEIRTRKWNAYLTQTLPKRIKVQIPIEDISLGKETFNRTPAEIKFDFILTMPRKYFKYENNIGSKIFEIIETEFSEDDKNWIRLQPKFSKFQIESDKARKLEVLEKKGYLIFEITMKITREAGWLHFYQTIFGFVSVQWFVEDEILWQLETLPFEDILNRDKN
jgi:hypothetical protein